MRDIKDNAAPELVLWALKRLMTISAPTSNPIALHQRPTTSYMAKFRVANSELSSTAIVVQGLDPFLRRGVFGTFVTKTPFYVARTADFPPASPAFAIFPTIVDTTTCVDVHVARFNP